MEAIRVRSDTSVTEVINVDPSQTVTQSSSPPVLRLRLTKKTRNNRKVVWREGTIDNEDMGKKKSKCCCIYKKPTAFGESSSEDDEECEHCFGHPEKRRKNIKKRQQNCCCTGGNEGPSCSQKLGDNTATKTIDAEGEHQDEPTTDDECDDDDDDDDHKDI